MYPTFRCLFHKPHIFIVAFLLTIPTLLQADNTCLNFDIDDNEQAEASLTDENNITGEAITIECWINPAEIHGVAEIIASMGGAPAIGGWKIRIDPNGNFQGRFGWDAPGWVGTAALEADEWQHVAIVYDGEAVSTYVNGEFDTSSDANGNLPDTDHPLRFNRREDDAANFYDGMIDEFRLWDVARTEDELAENMNRYLTGDEDGLVAYYSFDEGEGQVIRDKTANENHGWIGADEDEDNRDPEWIEEGAPIFGGEIGLSTEEIIFDALLTGESQTLELAIANITEEEDDAFIVTYWLEEEEGRPEWLDIADDEGEVAPGDTAIIEFTANSEGIETGLYEYAVLFRSNSQNIDRVEIPIEALIVDGYGSLTGIVYDEATDDPLAGSTVFLSGDLDYETVCDEEGSYSFRELPSGEYSLMINIDRYIPFRDTLEIIEDEELEFNIGVLHGMFEIEQHLVEESLEPPPDTLVIELNVSNEGNGEVNWQMTRIVPEPQNDYFDLLEEINVGQPVDDDRIQGVAYHQGIYYVAGSSDGNDNYIYMFNSDGEYINRLLQPVEARLGVNDLAWDGNLLWMCHGDDVYGITLDGELEVRVAGPTATCKNIAWDHDMEVLWISGTTTDIFAVDAAGDDITALERPYGFLINGLAYHPEDPDGYNLYLIHEDRDAHIQVLHKMNTATGDTMWVANLAEGSEPAGAEIIYDYDAQSWVFMNINTADVDDGGAEVNVWQMNSKVGWADIGMDSGTIAAGEDLTWNLYLDATWLLNDTYTQELIFIHDGKNEADTISVSLQVIRPDPPSDPTELTAIEENPRRVTLGWTYEGDDATSFNVERRRQDEEVFSVVASPAGDQRTHNDSTEVIYVRYYYRLRATNEAGASGYTDEVMIRPEGGPPLAFDLAEPSNGDTLMIEPEVEDRMFEFNWNPAVDLDPEDARKEYLLWFSLEGGDSMSFEPDETTYSIHQDSISAWGIDGTTWWVTVESGPHMTECSERFSFILTTNSIDPNRDNLPIEFGLNRIYPNPFNSTLKIEFGLPVSSTVALSIYDLTGRRVASLIDEQVEAGFHSLEWNAGSLPGGVYIIRLNDEEGNRALQKALLIK